MYESPCVGCGRKLRVQPEWTGKQIKCPQCQTVQVVGVGGTLSPVAGGPLPPIGSPGMNQPPAAPAGSPGSDYFSDLGSSPEPKPAKGFEINPYAAPAGQTRNDFRPVQTVNRQPWSHATIDTGAILTRTLDVYKENINQVLLVGLVLFGQAFAINIVANVMQQIAQMTKELAVFIIVFLLVQVFSWLVSTWFQIGAVIFGLKVARGEEAGVNDLFKAHPYYGRGLLLSIIIFLAGLGIALVCSTPVAVVIGIAAANQGKNIDPAIVVIPTIICLIPLFIGINYIILRWFVALVMIVDHDLPVLESLAKSSEYMNGSKLATFLALVIVGLAGLFIIACTCGLGSILFVPYISLMPVVIYLSVTGQPIAKIRS